MFSPTVSNLLLLFYFLLSSGFLISVTVFLLLDFFAQKGVFLSLFHFFLSLFFLVSCIFCEFSIPSCLLLIM